MTATVSAIAPFAIGTSTADLNASSPPDGNEEDAFAALFEEIAAAMSGGAPGSPPPASGLATDEDLPQELDAAAQASYFLTGLPLAVSLASPPPSVPAPTSATRVSLAGVSSSLAWLAEAPARAAATGEPPHASFFAAGGLAHAEGAGAVDSGAPLPLGEEAGAARAASQTVADSPPPPASPALTADAAAPARPAMAPAVAHADAPLRTAWIEQPVGSPPWADAVGQRLTWFAQQGDSRAELILHPPHLGRIEVVLSLAGDAASAQFASANPVVRDALEAALPRLREILAAAGIMLGQTDIGAEFSRLASQQGQTPDDRSLPPARQEEGAALALGELTAQRLPGRGPTLGLIDLFV